MYEYKAVIVSIYDADTIRVAIDLGLGQWTFGRDGKGESIRLHGIDAPELKGEERPDGLTARDYLREKLPKGTEITLRTIKDKKGKFGRYLGIVILPPGIVINNDLVLKGYAVKKEH